MSAMSEPPIQHDDEPHDDESSSSRHSTDAFRTQTLIELRREIAGMRVDVSKARTELAAATRTMLGLANIVQGFSQGLADVMARADVMSTAATSAQAELAEALRKSEKMFNEWHRATFPERSERPTDPELVTTFSMDPEP